MGSDEDDGFPGLLDEATSVDERFPGSMPRPGLFLFLLMSTGTRRRTRMHEFHVHTADYILPVH